jgi:hypothetical protein
MLADQPTSTRGSGKADQLFHWEGRYPSVAIGKAHVASQILAGVTAIQPASAVLSVATGTEKDKLEVASGEYKRMIDDKIATIKKTCGMCGMDLANWHTNSSEKRKEPNNGTTRTKET